MRGMLKRLVVSLRRWLRLHWRPGFSSGARINWNADLLPDHAARGLKGLGLANSDLTDFERGRDALS